jgi:hypothetical protein
MILLSCNWVETPSPNHALLDCARESKIKAQLKHSTLLGGGAFSLESVRAADSSTTKHRSVAKAAFFPHVW